MMLPPRNLPDLEFKINGLAQPCYLCNALTARPTLGSGVRLCERCWDREFPVIRVNVPGIDDVDRSELLERYIR